MQPSYFLFLYLFGSGLSRLVLNKSDSCTPSKNFYPEEIRI
jgi:hypothetical protein